MVKPLNKTINQTFVVNPCNFEEQTGEAEEYNGDFTWDEFTQSLVLGSFFWGYIWLQVPGGRLAEVIGPRRVYGCAILGSAILTLFIPVASHSSPIAVMVVRFLMGLSQGPCFPSTHAFLAIWAPPQERSFISTIIYAGGQAGTILAFPMAASIINSLGWEYVFYIQASITIIWAIAWFVLVTDKPEDFRWISESEKEYLKKTISPAKNEKSPPLPWKSILTSVPFLAIIIADLGNNWGFFTLATDLPLYMKNMLRTNISNNAQLSGFPYLGMWIFSLLISVIADFSTRRRILNVTWVRKLATLIAHGGPGICLFCLSFVECNRSWTVTLLFISITLQGGIYTGWLINHIDIAPNFAGTLYGITNGLSSIPAWVAPIVVGTLTNKNETFDSWRKVFFIAGGIFIFDAIFFLIFGSGEVQDWNFYEEKKSETDEDVKAKSEDILTLEIVPDKTSRL
ncbi:UNVERIFIED_CONTAM: hypothetical protein RMT77_019607 [Armadillidium vulgare]